MWSGSFARPTSGCRHAAPAWSPYRSRTPRYDASSGWPMRASTLRVGQTVIAAAERDDVSDPQAVSALAHSLRDELNGGARRHKEE
jgi:hypothetical protein